MNNNRNTVIAVGVVLGVSAITYLLWGTIMKAAPVIRNDTQGVACAMDALECPDGSWVGRSGLTCQFVCPIPLVTTTPKGAVTVETTLGRKVTPIAEGMTPMEVIEDSRCPHGVQCIQAGTVRVRVTIETESGTSVEIFSLNGTITTESEIMTLVAVRPEKEARKNIALNDYTFVFRVSKK